MLKVTTNKRLCPHLQEPFDECYCVKMSSQDIERAVYLCSMHYEICDIYKHEKGNGNGKSAAKRLKERPASC